MASYTKLVSSTQFILWDQHSATRAKNQSDRLWAGTRAFPMRQRFLYKRQLLFSLQVTFLADTRVTNLWQILVDPCGERPVKVGDLAGWVALPRVWPLFVGSRSIAGENRWCADQEQGDRWQSWTAHQGRILQESGDYELNRLYAKACEYLQTRLPQAMQRLEAEKRARHEQEKRQLNEYYHQLTQEAMHPLRKLFRRLAVATVRADLARAPQTQEVYASRIMALKREIEAAEAVYQEYLEEIRQDMSWRLGELEARYSTKVQVSLEGIACIWAPYIEFTFHLSTLPGEHRYLYNCIANQFADTICDTCMELTCHLNPCSCGNVVCDDCYSVCPGCGKAVCRTCAGVACHICGAFTCEACAASCPFSLLTLAICPTCLQKSCSICTSLVGYGWQLPQQVTKAPVANSSEGYNVVQKGGVGH